MPHRIRARQGRRRGTGTAPHLCAGVRTSVRDRPRTGRQRVTEGRSDHPSARRVRGGTTRLPEGRGAHRRPGRARPQPPRRVGTAGRSGRTRRRPRDTVAREITEETGLEVQVGRWLLHEPFQVTPGQWVTIDAYLCSSAKDPVEHGEEHQEAGWFPVAGLPEALPEVYRRAIRVGVASVSPEARPGPAEHSTSSGDHHQAPP